MRTIVVTSTSVLCVVSICLGSHDRPIDLSNADFANQDLRDADFSYAILAGADFSGANLKNAIFSGANLKNAIFDAETEFNQWTVFPDNFDPVAAGLKKVIQPAGDFDANGLLEIADLDLLVNNWYCDGCTRYGNRISKFDLNENAQGDHEDLRIWVEDIYGSCFGDANLDGDVGFDDFVTLSNNFGKPGTWSDGDFNADREVKFGDFLILSASFGKPLGGSVAAPEPCACTMAVLLVTALMPLRNRRSFSSCL